MKLLRLFPLTILTALPLFAESPVCSCCVITPTATTSETPVVHPVKGVIVNILPERSALLVKHEEIPDFMKAMTMMFKVDADTLKSVKKGQAITGNLIKKADGFWLEDVKVSTDS